MGNQPEAACGSPCIRLVPSFLKELVEQHYAMNSDKAPNLTTAQWLRAQPEAVRQRESLRVLRKFGLVRL